MSPAQKRLTLAAAILGSIVAFVDTSVVNVALPRIREDLGGGLAGQQWLTDGYLLTLGALLLVGGSLGDLFGRRRVFAVGLAGFAVASVGCAAAPSIGALVAARAVQGIAGALLVPNTLGLLVARFEPAERGAAIGAWTAWSGIAMVLGPLIGGVLLIAGSWRWIFLINVVPIAVALVLTSRLDASHDQPPGGHVDLPGAVLATAGLAGPVFALIEQQSRGWGDPAVLAALVGGLAVLGGFVAWERRSSHPMLPLELFAERNFAVGNAATLAVYGGLSVVPFFLVVYLQQVAGYSPLGAGVAMLPVTAIMFALSRRWGALADRRGPRAFMGAGPVVAGAGLALLVRLDASAPYPSQVLPAVVVFGLGLSLTVAPLTAAVLGGVAEEHAGVASAVNNAVARVAGLVAIAAIGAIVAAQFTAAVDARATALSGPARAYLSGPARTRALVTAVPPRLGAQRPAVRRVLEDGSVDAFHTAMIAVAALVAAGGLLSAAGIRNPRREVASADCPGGAAVGAAIDLAEHPGRPAIVAGAR